MKPELTTTISEFIASGSGTLIDYDELSFKDRLSNGTLVSSLNVVSDYMDELKSVSMKVKLTPEQFRKYKYKPKLLCYDVYGNPELYFILLLINDIADVKEFNRDVIRMIKKDTLLSMLSAIFNAERKMLMNYNQDK